MTNPALNILNAAIAKRDDAMDVLREARATLEKATSDLAKANAEIDAALHVIVAMK